MQVMLERKPDHTIVQIDNDTLLDTLVERVKFWKQDDEIIELFEQMYQNAIDNGVFDEMEFNVKRIVDNDVINYCNTYHKDDLTPDDWDRLKKHYEEGDTDISCESFDFSKASFIEAINDEAVLLRC